MFNIQLGSFYLFLVIEVKQESMNFFTGCIRKISQNFFFRTECMQPWKRGAGVRRVTAASKEKQSPQARDHIDSISKRLPPTPSWRYEDIIRWSRLAKSFFRSTLHTGPCVGSMVCITSVCDSVQDAVRNLLIDHLIDWCHLDSLSSWNSGQIPEVPLNVVFISISEHF